MINGKQISEARKTLGLSVLALATMCVVSQATVLSVEAGETASDSKAFERIQKTLVLNGATFSEA